MLVDSAIPLYHNLLDCGMRKLTVGRSIAWEFLSRSLFTRLILIQSLDCYDGASDFVENYTYRHGKLTYNHNV